MRSLKELLVDQIEDAKTKMDYATDEYAAKVHAEDLLEWENALRELEEILGNVQ